MPVSHRADGSTEFTIGESAMIEGEAYRWSHNGGMVFRHQGPGSRLVPVLNLGSDQESLAKDAARQLNEAFMAGMEHEAYNRDCGD